MAAKKLGAPEVSTVVSSPAAKDMLSVVEKRKRQEAEGGSQKEKRSSESRDTKTKTRFFFQE